VLRVLNPALFRFHSVLFLFDRDQHLVVQLLLLLLVIVLDLAHQLLERLEACLATHVLDESDAARCLV